MEQAQKVGCAGIPQAGTGEPDYLTSEQIDSQKGDADFYHKQPQALGDHHYVLVRFFIIFHEHRHGCESAGQAAHDGTEKIGKGVPVHIDGHTYGNGQGEQGGSEDAQGLLAQFDESFGGAIAADAVAGYAQHGIAPLFGPVEGTVQESAEDKTGGDTSQHIGNGDAQLPQPEPNQGSSQEGQYFFHDDAPLCKILLYYRKFLPYCKILIVSWNHYKSDIGSGESGSSS